MTPSSETLGWTLVLPSSIDHVISRSHERSPDVVMFSDWQA